jgi:hypothetical protein
LLGLLLLLHLDVRQLRGWLCSGSSKLRCLVQLCSSHSGAVLLFFLSSPMLPSTWSSIQHVPWQGFSIFSTYVAFWLLIPLIIYMYDCLYCTWTSWGLQNSI